MPLLRLVFGDLHLADIRDWRTSTFGGTSGHPCMFPVFGVPYTSLQATLFGSPDVAEVRVSAATGPLAGPDGAAAAVAVVGARYDAAFVAALPAGVDPMGESGEFHTHVVFKRA